MLKLVMIPLMLTAKEPTRLIVLSKDRRAKFSQKSGKTVKDQKLKVHPTKITPLKT